MKTSIYFYDYESKKQSDCGDSLEIDVSSRNLGLNGIILEKGSSPCFYPNNVATPYFYFALSRESELSWVAYPNKEKISLNTIKGEIWINPPHTPFTHEINETCHFIILALDEGLVMDIIKQFDYRAANSLEFINNYNVDDDIMRNLIELIYQDVQKNWKNGYGYIESLVRALVIHYVKNYSNMDDFQMETDIIHKTINDKGVIDIDRFIEDHVHHSISIDELAKLVNLSKFHFLKEFKKLKGITPYQYVLQKRLSLAKWYLQNTNRVIAEIALQVGFADQSHFTRTFKLHNGITPLDYRNSNF